MSGVGIRVDAEHERLLGANFWGSRVPSSAQHHIRSLVLLAILEKACGILQTALAWAKASRSKWTKRLSQVQTLGLQRPSASWKQLLAMAFHTFPRGDSRTWVRVSLASTNAVWASSSVPTYVPFSPQDRHCPHTSEFSSAHLLSPKQSFRLCSVLLTI